MIGSQSARRPTLHLPRTFRWQLILNASSDHEHRKMLVHQSVIDGLATSVTNVDCNWSCNAPLHNRRKQGDAILLSTASSLRHRRPAASESGSGPTDHAQGFVFSSAEQARVLLRLRHIAILKCTRTTSRSSPWGKTTRAQSTRRRNG